jgi:hypothetical protein
MKNLVQEPVVLDGIHCKISIEQPATGLLILRLSGMDIGEFGETPMNALEEQINQVGPVHLFIDARNVVGASIEVSGDWARWLGQKKAQLQSINMLTGSRFIEITAEFVRRFADLQGIMRIYTDASSFDAAVTTAAEQMSSAE